MPKSSAMDIDCSRKELQGFKTYYEHEIAPGLAELQKPQAKAIKRYYHTLGAGLLLFITVILSYLYFDLRLHQDWGVYFYIIPVVYLLVIIFGPTIPLSNIQSNALGFMLDKTSDFLGLRYQPTPDDFPLTLIKESGLLPKYHYHNLKDGFNGNYRGVEFALAECSLTRCKGSGDEKTYSTVYQGLLLAFRLKVPFTGRILISRDAGVVGNFFNLFKQPPRIKLSNQKFESKFNVYATDEEEARSLFTDAYLENLHALDSSMAPGYIEVAYLDNYMLISANSYKERFKSQGIFHPINEPSNVKEILKEICFVYDLIDILRESPWAEEKWGSGE